MALEMFNLRHKTAVVTGGAGILGNRFCEVLAGAGANTVVVDIDEKKAKRTADRLSREFKGRVAAVACDVSCPDSVQQMVKQVTKEFGNINILVNNAAGKSKDLDKFFADFEDYSLDTWREIMSVNIDGMFLTAQAVGKSMIKRGGGSIIQTASIYGLLAPDKRIYEGSLYNGRAINSPAVYAVSKSAVIGLTKYLAVYWADKNIRVNCLVPGGVQSGQNDEFIKKYSARVPLGRMAEPDELSGAVLYLASEASSYVTGQNIIVDGGLSVW